MEAYTVSLNATDRTTRRSKKSSAAISALRADPDAYVATAANVADATILPDLLHADETKVWGDQAYKGQKDVIREHAPREKDFTNRRYRYKGRIDEVQWAKNRTKSKVRAKVEHVFGVIKRVFGFVKVGSWSRQERQSAIRDLRARQSVHGERICCAIEGHSVCKIRKGGHA